MTPLVWELEDEIMILPGPVPAPGRNSDFLFSFNPLEAIFQLDSLVPEGFLSQGER